MNTVIVSGPVIIENKRVLLTKHGNDNFWKFPGGKIKDSDFQNQNDLLENICARETKEELGIDINIVRPLKPLLITKPNDPSSAVILIHFLSERIGEIKPEPDIREWNWFDIDKLPEDCAPNIKLIIEDYKK